MRTSKDSVNVSIFTALKVGEKARNVPVLLMSNPGMGKSTTVSIFAKHRGYHLQLLKGNSTSETEIIGYDVVPTKDMRVEFKDNKSTVHLRPSWFSEILKKEEEGIPTLLFLDELTTAPEHVQSALLQLVFDRKVGDEDLPESTLVVAAGNYIQNLSNQMNLIPPLMNRFMIYNIEADDTDIDSFLCKYKGAIASPNGSIDNNFDRLKKILEDMDKKELKLSDSMVNKVGEYIERQIAETARSLMKGGDKPLSFKVSDLQSIYGDTIDDQVLYGFATLRTLGYLRDVTLASYMCFGKSGITSDAYENMVAGLCGIGLSRDNKTKEVKKTILTHEFMDSMKVVINDVERMNKSSIPLYENFLKELLTKIDKTKGWEVPELNLLKSKMEEMMNDKSLNGVERPIDSSIVTEILKGITTSINSVGVKNLKVNVNTTPEEWREKLPPEQFASMINKWNSIMNSYKLLEKFISIPKIGYNDSVMNSLKSTTYECKVSQFKLQTLNKIMEKNGLGYEKLVPKLQTPTSF